MSDSLITRWLYKIHIYSINPNPDQLWIDCSECHTLFAHVLCSNSPFPISEGKLELEREHFPHFHSVCVCSPALKLEQFIWKCATLWIRTHSSYICTDNGRNFVGPEKELRVQLQSLDSGEIQEKTAHKSIK